MNLYWTKATAGPNWPAPWDGSANPPSPATPIGNPVGSQTISTIAAGSYRTLVFEWTLPDPASYPEYFTYAFGGGTHFCLLARITPGTGPNPTPEPMFDERTPTTQQPQVLYHNLKYNNNIAQKNVTIIDHYYTFGSEGAVGGVGIGNFGSNPVTVDLVFDAENSMGSSLVEEAEVRIILDDNSWDIWQNGGGLGEGFTIEDANKHVLLATSAQTRLDNLAFSANQQTDIAVKVNFLTEELTEKTVFNYDVIQVDASDDSVIGSERFIVLKSDRPEGELFSAAATTGTPVPQQGVTAQATDIIEPASYKWYSTDTTLVDTGLTVTFNPSQNTTYLLEVTADADGYKDYTEVTVPAVSQNYIVSLTPNPATSNVTASYHLDSSVQSATLTVVAASNTTQTLLSQALNVQQSQITLNASSLQPGVYIVNLVCGGNIQDGEQLVIQ